MMNSFFLVVMLGASLSGSPVSGDESTKIRIARLYDLYVQDRIEAAYQMATEWVAEDGEIPEAWLWLGLLARQQRQDEEALQAFHRALSLRKDYAEAYVQLGDLLAQQEQWQEAIQAYRRVREIRPEWAGVCTRLGGVYRQNGLWTEAVKEYERALELGADESRVRPMLELCRSAQAEVEEQGVVTAETLNQLAALPPGDADYSGDGARGLDMDEATPSSLSALPVHIEFRRGQFALYNLSERGREQLEQVATALGSPQWQGKRIVIEGHTCSCGLQVFNHTLGRQRAETVRDYLVAQDIVPADSVSIFSLGEEEPVVVSPHEDLPPAQCELDPVHSQNRRVRIRKDALETEVPPIDLAFSIPPSLPAKVAWWYRHKNTGGLFRPLEKDTTLYSGDELRLFLTVKTSAYVYIFHHSSQGEWVCLFPYSPIARQSQAENPVQADRKYWIPNIGSSIVLDEVSGQEETFVYLSSQPVPEMERWARDGLPSDMEGPLTAEHFNPSQETQRGHGERGYGGIVTLEEDTETPQETEPPDEFRWFVRLAFDHR